MANLQQNVIYFGKKELNLVQCVERQVKVKVYLY